MEKKKPSYKNALKELESIVARIESDSVDIDELTTLVKRAAELVKYCRQKLHQAEEELDKNLGDLE